MKTMDWKVIMYKSVDYSLCRANGPQFSILFLSPRLHYPVKVFDMRSRVTQSPGDRNVANRSVFIAFDIYASPSPFALQSTTIANL